MGHEEGLEDIPSLKLLRRARFRDCTHTHEQDVVFWDALHGQDHRTPVRRGISSKEAKQSLDPDVVL